MQELLNSELTKLGGAKPAAVVPNATVAQPTLYDWWYEQRKLNGGALKEQMKVDSLFLRSFSVPPEQRKLQSNMSRTPTLPRQTGRGVRRKLISPECTGGRSAVQFVPLRTPPRMGQYIHLHPVCRKRRKHDSVQRGNSVYFPHRVGGMGAEPRCKGATGGSTLRDKVHLSCLRGEHPCRHLFLKYHFSSQQS